MSVQFIWKDNYSVGNPEIDDQHRDLFNLCNQLSESLTEKECKFIIMKLFKYTRLHFTAEEKLMKDLEFPLFVEHHALHDALITDLSEISLKPLDTADAIDGFKQFVFNWLINHIMNEDFKFFKFYQTKK